MYHNKSIRFDIFYLLLFDFGSIICVLLSHCVLLPCLSVTPSGQNNWNLIVKLSFHLKILIPLCFHTSLFRKGKSVLVLALSPVMNIQVHNCCISTNILIFLEHASQHCHWYFSLLYRPHPLVLRYTFRVGISTLGGTYSIGDQI